MDYALGMEVSMDEENDIIREARRYIEENFREDLNRERIASTVFVSPNYLSKLFRQNTHHTLREYINSCRIREAQTILQNGEESVSDVALRVGFDNVSYFSVVFKRLCGVSPTEWRGNHCA